jgi:hypothetical protein
MVTGVAGRSGAPGSDGVNGDGEAGGWAEAIGETWRGGAWPGKTKGREGEKRLAWAAAGR